MFSEHRGLLAGMINKTNYSLTCNISEDKLRKLSSDLISWDCLMLVGGVFRWAENI